ncbi:hypothetical protein ACIG87_12650 [Micromonospora sp. NPDC051925]|uniref:hypothetical protein n=1 Tax=Micromonospora sp. NPDC051925 TaxID=3364288 RepID=UPI0037C6B416
MTPGQSAGDSEGMMRGLVLMESLTDGRLPMPLPAVVVRRYPHLLGGTLPVQIAELAVTRHRVLAVAMQVAKVLLPKRFYAHFLDDERMYVVFPNCVTVVLRDDPVSADTARAVGALFDIPAVQMRFEEMFVNDHPDSPRTEAAA